MDRFEKYIRHMRKQPAHKQHMHAFIFASVVTAIIIVIVLYVDYGFWHQRYKAVTEESIKAEEQRAAESMESPGQTFSNFWAEAKKQFDNMGTAGAGILEGKESYQKDSP